MKNTATIAKCMLLISVIISVPACKKMPIYALAGTTLIVSSDKTFLKTGGDKATITVIGFTADGEPLHDHTLVNFTATLGTIPASSEMISGRATVEFVSGDRGGVTEIVARSGSITATSTTIFIGSGALETLTIHANPTSLGARGGKSLITVYAFDNTNNPLADIPVILSTTAGELDRGNSIRLTDKNGMVNEYLYTEKSTTVRAEAGSISAEVEVTVDENQLPSADFSISPSSVKIDETAYFNGSISTDTDGWIENWEWNFGDGNSGRGEKTTHAFSKAGTYTVTLKVTDNDGGCDVHPDTITITE
jgi:PKD repeat protein